MARRLFGVLLLLISLSGIIASYVGIRLGHQIVDRVGSDIVSSLTLVADSLDRVEDSLLLAKMTVVDISDGLFTLEATVSNLGDSVEQTQPLLDQVGQIAGEDVPDSLESIEQAIPAMAQAAAVVDDTLTTLSQFRLETSVLGVPIGFDLGIDYDPAIPFDESVMLVGESLDGVPEELRSMKSEIELAQSNLEKLSGDLEVMAADLATISDRISETEPLLEEYQRIVLEVNDATRQVKNNLSDQLATARTMVTMVMVWLGLAQLAPLYLGWELSRGRRLR